MKNPQKLSRTILSMALFGLSCAAANGAWAAASDSDKLDPQLAVQQSAVSEKLEALIEVRGKMDKGSVERSGGDYMARRYALVDSLRSHAASKQAALVDWLKANNIEHKAYWINNTIFVKADLATLKTLSKRADVAFVYGNPKIVNRKPLPEAEGFAAPRVNTATAAVEWGVDKIGAPKVWAAGIDGTGIVIAGEDTGYKWDHPAIKGNYRGWNGSSANHAYNWHDGTHSGTSSCAPNQTVPCDDNGHGTHTVGTMVGSGGIGVAPGAKWIGCRNMIGGLGTPSTYTECLQWLIAPTDAAGNNPDPSKAPHISSHSWGCPTSEGCTSVTVLKQAVDNVINAGIMVIAAAGNDGSACGTINDAPGALDSAFTIGSTTSANAMSSFSGRGPATGATTIKPDVSAPGSSVRSAWNNDGYNTISGTSMATPHVAGAAALLMQANPSLKGNPAQVAAILRASAVSVTNTQSCGGVAASTLPNYVVGAGIIDAYAAYQRAIGVTPTVALTKDTAVGVSAATGAKLNYTFAVPTGATNLTFKLTGGTGNGDLYTQLGSAPTTTTYLARSAGTTNTETITVAAPTAGTYYVLMDSVSAVSGASLVASYTPAVSGNVLTSGVPVTGITLAKSATKTYSIVVPAGKTSLTFKLSGGTGDGDLYAKLGTAPTTTVYDKKSTGSTNAETITYSAPVAGTYYVMVRAYTAVSGASLVATVQ